MHIKSEPTDKHSHSSNVVKSGSFGDSLAITGSIVVIGAQHGTS